MACASTRRSRTRATSTGPTGWACWSGRRCRAPIASPEQSIERLDPRVDGRDAPRLQPPLHRRLGAVQRVLGRAGPARHPRAAPLRPGALPPHQDARPHAPGDRQRRLGEQRHRHHRHPRLRRRPRAHRQRYWGRGQSRASFTGGGPGGRLSTLDGMRTAASRSCSPSSAGSPCRRRGR